MNAVDAAATIQIVGDLLQPILAAIEYHHFNAVDNAIHQLLVVLHIAVDKDHFLALFARSARCGDVVAVGLAVGVVVSGRVDHRGGNGAIEHHARLQRLNQGWCGGLGAGVGCVGRFLVITCFPPHESESLAWPRHCVQRREKMIG